jgi:hypothetical protein
VIQIHTVSDSSRSVTVTVTVTRTKRGGGGLRTGAWVEPLARAAYSELKRTSPRERTQNAAGHPGLQAKIGEIAACLRLSGPRQYYPLLRRPNWRFFARACSGGLFIGT